MKKKLKIIVYFTIFSISLYFISCNNNNIKNLEEKEEYEKVCSERYLESLVISISKNIKKIANNKRIGIIGIYDKNFKFKVGISNYLTPKLIEYLSKIGVNIIEREDLKPLLKEKIIKMNNVSTTEEFLSNTKIEGVDLLFLGKIDDLDNTHYRLNIKVINVDSSKIEFQKLYIIDRKKIPIKYGGK